MKWHACIVASGVGAAIGLALACGRDDAFECSSDAQCVQGSEIGFCENTGFCSFEDPDCPSGRRYGALAGNGLAHTCVDAAGTDVGSGSIGPGDSDPPTSMSSPTDPTVDPPGTSTTEAPSPTEDDSTSDPPLPGCGDGNLDPGEACDDGDDEEGDGCNPDCTVSGTVLCSHVGGVDLPLHAYGIDLAWIGDDFVVTGWEQTDDEGDNVVLLRYDARCGLAWSVSHDEGLAERGFAIAVDDNATIWVGGAKLDEDGVPTRYVARFDGDGGFLGSYAPGLGVVEAMGATPGGGAVAAGFVGSSYTNAVAWAAYYEADGSFGGQVLSDSGEADRVRSLVVDDALTLFATGNRGTDINDVADLVVDAIDRTGFDERARVPPTLGLADGQAIAMGSGGDLFVGGYVQIAEDPPMPTSPRDAYVARVTQAGDIVWSDIYGTPAVGYSDEVEAIAVAPNDDVIVGGFVNVGAPTASDLWLRRYTEDGEIRWDVTIDVGVADVLREIAFGPAGQLAVVGEAQGDDGYMNTWVAIIAQ